MSNHVRCVCLVSLIFVLAVQNGAAQISDDPQKEANIRTLIEITGSAEIGVEAGTMIMLQLEPVFRQAFPAVPPDLMEEIFEEMHLMLRSMDVVAVVGPVYDRHFTAEEIEAMLDFYRTPLGMRMIEAMPDVMRESMEAGQAWGLQASEEVAERLLRRLQAAGYTLE